MKVKAYRYVFSIKAPVTIISNEFWAKGDVNRDGKIDSADLEKIRSLFGKRTGDAEFDPACDLNNDGIINIKDATICQLNQGQTAPEFITPFETDIAAGTLYCTYKNQALKADVKDTTKKVTFVFMTLMTGHSFVR